MTRASGCLAVVLSLLGLLALDGLRADASTMVQSKQYMLPGADRSSSNLLANPGFELGIEGWDAWPSGATFDVVSTRVHGGDFAAALTKTEARGHTYIFQNVDVTPGGSYAAEVWAVLDDPGLTNVKLRIQWLDASGAPSGEILSADSEQHGTDYQLLRLGEIIAPEDATSARIQGYTYVNTAGPAQPALFDDFSFVATSPQTTTPQPSPTTITTPTRQPSPTSHPPSVTPTATATATATPTALAAGAVVVNEVVYDPATPGGDPNDEWVELHNTTASPVDIGGWRLADNVSADTLPAFELPPRGFLVVATSDTFRTLFPAYGGLLIVLASPIGNGLANTGDVVSLWHADGRLIDGMSYGDNSDIMFPPVPLAEPGYSLERVPAGNDTDTAADWYPRSRPTPGEGVRIWRRYMPVLAAATERGFPLWQ
jgi:hypothetical protein